MSISLKQSQAWMERARHVMPGGVNSPVRAFRAVGGDPPMIRRAKGAYLWDEDGNQYIDYVGSWGPMILGHAHPDVVAVIQAAAEEGTSYGAPTVREVLMAEKIREFFPVMEMTRLVNSGTEATMSAIRLARAATQRDRVIKFSGCYHGHGDAFLIAAGSGATTFGVPNSPGVTAATAAYTLLAEYNDLGGVEKLFQEYPDSIAAIIVEPVPGNMGLIKPEAGFLEGLRSLSTQHGALLIFDEVMTGFRVAPGGVTELMGVTPDLVTLGKIIGGGLPVGAYGGRADLMKMVAPSGPVYQAGTLSGNPLATAAGLATLERLTPAMYASLEESCKQLEAGMRAGLQELGRDLYMTRYGSMICMFFSDTPVKNYTDARACDLPAFNRYFHAMLERGIYLPAAQFEALFVSAAHSHDDIERTIQAHKESLAIALQPA
ncbi:MAG: glutamate-1-semialdehyde 2,1-aminomutase [Myxococcales bacterium]|nr:glutamate-1-semialdehyde 2,1-aminomutase [Myxococcales bacterium]MCB9644330.1 glutamate-1-semialdehyde 2,1-aminomutase [Myxococcales bacterium]